MIIVSIQTLLFKHSYLFQESQQKITVAASIPPNEAKLLFSIHRLDKVSRTYCSDSPTSTENCFYALTRCTPVSPMI